MDHCIRMFPFRARVRMPLSPAAFWMSRSVTWSDRPDGTVKITRDPLPDATLVPLTVSDPVPAPVPGPSWEELLPATVVLDEPPVPPVPFLLPPAGVVA